MWSEGAGSLPDPDTLIQFLLTPMKSMVVAGGASVPAASASEYGTPPTSGPESSAEETVPNNNASAAVAKKRGSARLEAAESVEAPVSLEPPPPPVVSPMPTAGEGDEDVARRIARLEQRLDMLRYATPAQQVSAQVQTRRIRSRSPSPSSKDSMKEKRVTFAVRDSERSASDSERLANTAEVTDPEVMTLVTHHQPCKLCAAYAQRYREEQRERVKQEVTCATLGQALCGAEQERDKLKSGLAHIQSEIQRMKEETVRLESNREKTSRELRRSEEDCSDLQLKLKVMSECVRKRDLELSIQRQALDDRDRRLKDAQNEALAMSNKLMSATEQLQQVRQDNANYSRNCTELKDLLAERERQHIIDMKRKTAVDNPAVQKLVQKAAEEARAAAARDTAAARHKADKELAATKKENEKLAAAIAKFKNKFTELVSEKSALTDLKDKKAKEVTEALAASKEKDTKIAELNKTLKAVKVELEQLESKRKSQQDTHTATIAFLENRIKQLEAAQEEFTAEKIKIDSVKNKLSEAEKRCSEEMTLRKAGDARLSILRKQLDDLSAEQTRSAAKVQQQMEALRAELGAAQQLAAAKEKLAGQLSEQLQQLKQSAAAAAAEASRGRGDGSSELETERRRAYRLQVELDRLTENKTQLVARLEHAERELDRCAKKNEGWSKLWEEKVELIRKLEAQVKMGRSINEDKVASLRQERDRAMELAKQAARKLQTLDAEYQAKMDETRALFEAQLDGVRTAKDHELAQSAKRVREIEAMLKEVSAETAASRTSLEEKMRRINIITDGFES